MNLKWLKKDISKGSAEEQWIQLGVVLAIIILLNIVASFIFFRLDLTGDKRFTLTPNTKKLVKEVKDIISIQVLLEGEYPAGFKRLQASTKEMLDDFRALNKNINYEFVNPNEGTTKEINGLREKLKEQGIVPTNLRVKENDKTEDLIIYPYAIVNYGLSKRIVNLLESNQPGTSPEVVLNNSVALLEYKFANSIKKLLGNERKNVLILTGHRELEAFETQDFENALRKNYEVYRASLDTIGLIPKEISLIVIARPRTAFTEQEKFKIDQFVMYGGKILWMVDRLAVGLDSLRRPGASYVPYDYELNIEDQLYKYGARIQPNLVLDMECSRIPLQTGVMGNTPQYDLFPWYYYPIIAPKSNHPIVKSLDRVNFYFPSSIDTIQTKTAVKKTILLTSSRYSREQFTPVRLNLEILRYDPEPSKFNKSYMPVAVLLEGSFPSLFQNRLNKEMEDGLKLLGKSFKAESVPTRQIVIGDGDLGRNAFNPNTGEMRPAGYNPYEQRAFANKAFLVNCVEYLVDGEGIMAARSKEVKLRLLDGVKVKEEKSFWKLINIFVPILIVGLFGLGYNYWRRRKYSI